MSIQNKKNAQVGSCARLIGWQTVKRKITSKSVGYMSFHAATKKANQTDWNLKALKMSLQRKTK